MAGQLGLLEILFNEGTSDSRRATLLQGLERGYLREAAIPRAMAERERGEKEIP